jgi:hypothetical protein
MKEFNELISNWTCFKKLMSYIKNVKATIDSLLGETKLVGVMVPPHVITYYYGIFQEIFKNHQILLVLLC